MLQFLKDSIREMKHVVWPTRKETQKYFVLVLAILIFFGTYLFLFSNLFSTIVFGIKDMVNGSSSVNTEAIDTSFLDDISVTTASGEVLDIEGDAQRSIDLENSEENTASGAGAE